MASLEARLRRWITYIWLPNNFKFEPPGRVSAPLEVASPDLDTGEGSGVADFDANHVADMAARVSEDLVDLFHQRPFGLRIGHFNGNTWIAVTHSAPAGIRLQRLRWRQRHCRSRPHIDGGKGRSASCFDCRHQLAGAAARPGERGNFVQNQARDIGDVDFVRRPSPAEAQLLQFDAVMVPMTLE